MSEHDLTSANAPTESVLFVDDEQHILSSLRRLIRPLKLNTYFANSGVEGLQILAQHNIDLVVSDMRMPEMDGAEFLTQVRQKWPDTIRMLLTGYADMASTIEALNNGGIYRYISKPWEDDELKAIILDGLKLKRLEREKEELVRLTQQQNEALQDLNRNLEAKVRARTVEIRHTNHMLDIAYEELKDSYDSFVQVFSSFINARDVLKKGESKRLAHLSRRMAKALKLKDSTVRAVYYAALLHQMGKVGLPDRLLSVPEENMSSKDAAIYKQYPLVGETAISAIKGFEKTAALIRSHTEYYDGSGYPDGLPGPKTRSGARIIRAAHDFIALQTGLLLNDPKDADAAFAYIAERAEQLYDPIVVKCLDHFRKDYDISSLYRNEIQIESFALKEGMVLARDVFNSKNLLLISEGHEISTAMIEKIMGMEKHEGAKFKIFVRKNNADQVTLPYEG